QMDLLGDGRLEEMARRDDPRAAVDRVRRDDDTGGRPAPPAFALAPELNRRRQDSANHLITSPQRAAGGASRREEGEGRNTEGEPHASPFSPRSPLTTNPQ